MPERPPDPELEASTNHWMWWGVVLFALFVLAFPAYRLYEPEGREEAREQNLASLAETGAELYELQCAACHGSGDQVSFAPVLDSKEFLGSVSDDQIESLTAVGVPGSQMAAYSLDYGGPLTSEQIRAIAVYLRSLEEAAPQVPDWRNPGTTTTPPAGDGEVADGAGIYAQQCAACHGADLAGGIGPALGAGSEATTSSDEELTAVIAAGQGAMPGFQDSLTTEEIAALVGYLREVQQGG